MKYTWENVPLNTSVWGCAYSLGNNISPIFGEVTGIELDLLNKFVKYDSDESKYSYCYEIVYADTYEECVELYNSLINKEIECINNLINIYKKSKIKDESQKPQKIYFYDNVPLNQPIWCCAYNPNDASPWESFYRKPTLGIVKEEDDDSIKAFYKIVEGKEIKDFSDIGRYIIKYTQTYKECVYAYNEMIEKRIKETERKKILCELHFIKLNNKETES